MLQIFIPELRLVFSRHMQLRIGVANGDPVTTRRPVVSRRLAFNAIAQYRHLRHICYRRLLRFLGLFGLPAGRDCLAARRWARDPACWSPSAGVFSWAFSAARVSAVSTGASVAVAGFSATLKMLAAMSASKRPRSCL